MKRGPSPASWLSCYLHVSDGAARLVDELLVEAVGPCATDCISRSLCDSFFFIRYWENGPHVRFRLRAHPSDHHRVRSHVEAYFAESAVARGLLGRPELVLEAQDVSEVPGLVWAPYVPEVERYGGGVGMAIAESFFAESSRFALALVGHVRAGRMDRLGAGLAAMIVLLAEMTGGAAEAAGMARFHQYTFSDSSPAGAKRLDEAFRSTFDKSSTDLVPLIRTWWTAALQGALLEPLGEYASAARATRKKLEECADDGQLAPVAGDRVQVMQQLLPSYLHMTSNRLGVSRQEEAYLGHAIWRVLRQDHS